MYEQEKQSSAHLIILIVYTVLSVGLIGESFLLEWEKGAIVLLVLGLVLSWGLHITQTVPVSIRLWMYYVMTMLTFFFYGIHETSMFDMAPLMMVILIMYSVTEMYSIIRWCMITYYFTMFYDMFFVMSDSMTYDSLIISRIALHFVLVYIAGRLIKVAMNRRRRENSNKESIISRLEEINRGTEDFLANVSHELRTPINAVTGITTVMLKNEEDENKKKDIFSIQMAGHRLFNQIEDILDYTEIDNGKLMVGEELYMLTSIVNDIINMIKLQERDNMPELVFDIDATIPSALYGDGRKIKKILKHLIDNAIKFTKKGGVYVRIYTLQKEYGINLCMSVSDTGVGIVEKDIERITERFYQLNGGRNRRAGGLGLGLSIVSGLVAAMEGFLRIESTVGSGTTVYVSIPQKIADEAPAMVLHKKKDLSLGCYLNLEKYDVPEVRNFYNETINHLVKGLDISTHRVFDMDELERLTEKYQITHLFTGDKEYGDNVARFIELERNIDVVVIADDKFILPQGSRAKILRKPFYCLPVVNILNAGAVNNANVFEEEMIICPGIKALVVDDEPMNLMVAEGILKEYEMEVKTVNGGSAAIEICKKEHFDLVFLDHMMPEMDGVETLKRLRKIHSNMESEMIIIAFTANAVSGAREMFLNEGFDEFVSKPIEYMELERVLRKVLPKSSVKYVNKDYRGGRNGKTIDSKKVESATGQLDEKTTRTEIIARLEKGGIHTASGLQYCADSIEFYEELLLKFAHDSDEKKKNINNFFEQQDWENYRILVHALKSTAKMIGADSLSEKARLVEDAAKNLDIEYIKTNHEQLIVKYDNIVQSITDVFDPKMHVDGQKEYTELSGEELLPMLEELKGCFDTFETPKAEELLSQMDGYTYNGKLVNELLKDIKKYVEDFEIDAASESIEAVINSMKDGEGQ